MASEKFPLVYKGHPLRRKDNLIYYGSMAVNILYDAGHGHQEGQGSGRGQ